MPECWNNMVQLCEEWLHMSCEGFKTAPEGEWLCIVCRPPDVFVKVLLRDPQRLMIVKIRK